MQLRRLLLWSYVVLFVGQLVWASIAAAATEQIFHKHQQLKEREQHIVAELVQLELALDRVRRDSLRVKAELQQTHSDINGAQSQLIVSQQQLAACRQKLGLWLRHYYMEGQTHYFWILLGATDLRDFVNRLSLVGMVISQGVQDLNKTVSAQRVVQERADALQKLQRQLVDQQQRLEQTLAATKKLQDNRQEFLAATRLELGESQGEILRVVDGLHNTLKPLETVLARFKDAPWEKYKPDRLKWLGSKVQAHYSQQTLHKLLFGGTSLAGSVQIQLAAGQVTFRGTSADQQPFRITGQLTVSAGNVCFKPTTIQIGEAALTPELVKLVAGNDGLVYPVGILMGWQLSHIQIHEGTAVFELVPT